MENEKAFLYKSKFRKTVQDSKSKGFKSMKAEDFRQWTAPLVSLLWVTYTFQNWLQESYSQPRLECEERIVRAIAQVLLWAQLEQLVSAMQLEEACWVIKRSLWRPQATIEYWKDPHPFFALPQSTSLIHEKWRTLVEK